MVDRAMILLRVLILCVPLIALSRGSTVVISRDVVPTLAVKLLPGKFPVLGHSLLMVAVAVKVRWLRLRLSSCRAMVRLIKSIDSC